MLLDVWEAFESHFKGEKVKKADIESYINRLEASDTYDNLFFNQGYLQALSDVENEQERLEIRQGRNNT